MRAGVRLVLAHEMPGVGQTARGLPFSKLTSHTPEHLLKAEIYKPRALPLKGGPWRPVSLALLSQELAKPLLERVPVEVSLRPSLTAAPTFSLSDGGRFPGRCSSPVRASSVGTPLGAPGRSLRASRC